jgi:tRNA-specific 2-thiouridylase
MSSESPFIFGIIPTRVRAARRCCAPEDQYDARRTAEKLSFSHIHIRPARALCKRDRRAVRPDAYVAGETPSPCTNCNRSVKLKELFAIADKLGAERVATGHYARVMRDDTGTPFVAEGVDSNEGPKLLSLREPRGHNSSDSFSARREHEA